VTVSTSPSNLPEYAQLVKFLFQPFLSAADAVSVDCEYTIDRQRVWIRVAIDSADQGSAFGRGGRNIQAVRVVLQSAAVTVGQSIHLDVYGSNSGSRYRDPDDGQDPANLSSSVGTTAPLEHRPPISKPIRSAPNRRSTDGEDRRNGGGDSPSLPPPRPRR
jgi:uncharacterized protein